MRSNVNKMILRKRWYLLASAILGAATSLLLGPILAIFAAFSLGALACWRTDRVLVGLGATGLGLIAASLMLPLVPFMTTPMNLAGAAICALFITAPLVYANAQKARRKVFDFQERMTVTPPRIPTEEKTGVCYFVMSPYHQYENRNNPALWN
jgi:hypothetical protein